MSNCIPFGLLHRKTLFGRTYRFQNFTFETSVRLELQLCSNPAFSIHSRIEEIIFEIIMFGIDIR